MGLLIQNHVEGVIKMKDLSVKELKNIKGGFSLTSTAIKYVGDLIEILILAGRKLGSSLRRIGSGDICPLE